MHKAILFVFITFLSIVSCSPTFRSCTIPNQILITIVNHPIYKTFYIDEAFSHEEASQIAIAIRNWEKSMGGRFVFHIVYDVKYEDYYTSYSRDNIFIWKTDGYDPRIVNAEKAFVQGGDGIVRVIIGLYIAGAEPHSPVILLAIDRIAEDALKITVIHEVGHSLGLEHPDNKNSIMFAFLDTGAKKITRFDIDNLCGIYGCINSQPTIYNE